MAEKNESPATRSESSARTRAWVLFGLVAAAALLRLPLLGRSVWFDEACMSDQRIGTTAQWLATLYVDIHPPLFVSFMHFWNDWFGDGELAMRMPALISGLLCIPSIWWTGRRLVGERAAMFAAAMMALSPVGIWYSTEARLYAPMMLCTLFAFGSIDRLTDGSGRRHGLFWMHALNVAVMLALHYYLSVIVVALALLVPLLTRKSDRSPRGLLLVHGIGVLLLGGFVLVKLHLGQFETGQAYLRALDAEGLFDFVFVWAWTGNTLQASGSDLLNGLGVGFQWLGVVLLVLGTVQVARKIRTQPRGLLVLVGLLVLPTFLLGCVLIGYDSTYIARTMIAALPFVLLLGGAGLDLWPAKLRPFGAGLAMVLAAAALGTLYGTFDTRWTIYKPHPDWRGATAYLSSEIDAGNSGAPVFTSMPNPRSLSYYDQRIQDSKNLQVPLSPEQMAAKVEERLGASMGQWARELFAEFAEHNRKLLAKAELIVRRCPPAPEQLVFPEGFRGPFYVVRNEWHPHRRVDDSVEQLIAHELVEILHTERRAGVTVYKVRLKP